MTFKEELQVAVEHEKENLKVQNKKREEFDKKPIEVKLSDQYLAASITKIMLGIK